MGDWQNIQQVFELRIAIESEAAAMAARRATEDEVEAILKIATDYKERQVGRNVAEEDIQSEEFIDLDLAFHKRICEVCGNQMFVQLLDVLSGFLRCVQLEGCREDAERSRNASEEHLRIAKAIKERNAGALV